MNSTPMEVNEMKEKISPIVATLVTVIVLLSLARSARFVNVGPTPPIGTQQGLKHLPAPFYGISRSVTLDELVRVAKEAGLRVYLPSWLPKGLRLTAIYLKDKPFIAILVYSAEGNKDYRTAELTIQVVIRTRFIPTFEQLKREVEMSRVDDEALIINGWLVRLIKDASTGGDPLTRAKWGERALLVYIWIKGDNYALRYTIFAPILTSEEVKQMIRSMKPV